MPSVWLAVLVAAIAAATMPYAVTVQGLTVWPDEMLYVKQAAHIWATGALVAPGEPFFSSYGQLVPLVMAPVIGTLGVPSGLPVVHGIFAIALASTAVPVFLLARQGGLNDTAALVASALATITAWLSFAGTAMTEGLSMPLFAWFLLVAHRAMVRASPRADTLAVAVLALMTFARPQLVVLGVAFLVAILANEAGDLRNALRRHWVAFGLLGLCMALLIGLIIFAPDTAGGYIEVFGALLPSLAALTAAAENFAFVALATGAVPAVLGLAWAIERAHDPTAEPRERALGRLVLCTTVVLTLEVGLFGAGFLDGQVSITARYLFYLVVPFALGLLFALRERVATRPIAVIGAITVAVIVFTEGGSIASAIDAPTVSDRAALGGRLGSSIDPRSLALALGALTTVTVVAAVAVLRWRPRYAVTVVVAPLLFFGAATAVYRGQAIKVQSEAREVLDRPVDWVDVAAGRSAQVDAIPAPQVGVTSQELPWRNTIFWNSQVTRTLKLPTSPTWDTLQYAELVRVRPTEARITRTDGSLLQDFVIVSASERRFGLAGIRIAERGGIVLMRTREPGALRWAIDGIGTDGNRNSFVAPQLHVFRRSGEPPIEEVRLRLRDSPGADCPCRVTFAGGVAELDPGSELILRESPNLAPNTKRAYRLSIPPGVTVESVAAEYATP